MLPCHSSPSLSCMLRYYRDYSYWFFLLYCSVSSRSFLNFFILSSFIFPAFKALRFAFNQFNISLSSATYFDGFLWFVSRKSTTSSYRFCQRSSCVIHQSMHLGKGNSCKASISSAIIRKTLNPLAHLFFIPFPSKQSGLIAIVRICILSIPSCSSLATSLI